MYITHMTTLQYIMVSGLTISLLSTTGVLLMRSHEGLASFIERNLTVLGAMSAGVFLVTSTILMRETLELLPLKEALLAFALGALAYWILHYIFSHHRDGEHEHHGKKVAWKVLIGDVLHNIADGLLLVTSFTFGIPLGLSTALSISLHEVPQEISEFIVLKRSGYTTNQAVFRNFLTALSIFIGIGIGLFFLQSATIQAYLLGITSSFFIGIIFTDLFPLTKVLSSKKVGKLMLALILGCVGMTLVMQIMPHTHEHKEVVHLNKKQPH